MLHEKEREEFKNHIRIENGLTSRPNTLRVFIWYKSSLIVNNHLNSVLKKPLVNQEAVSNLLIYLRGWLMWWTWFLLDATFCGAFGAWATCDACTVKSAFPFTGAPLTNSVLMFGGCWNGKKHLINVRSF